MSNAHREAEAGKPRSRLMNMFYRWKVASCMDLPDADAVPRIRGLGQDAVPCLVGKIAEGGPESAKAAHLMCRLAEWRHIDCVSAIGPLENLVKRGDVMEAQNAAMALLSINTEESILAALRGYVGGGQTARKCVVSAFRANGNEWVRTYLEAVSIDCEDESLKAAAKRVLLELEKGH